MVKTSNEINIPEIEFGRLLIRIKGTTPLITNRFSEDKQRQIEEKQAKDAKLKKPPREPEREFRDACYTIPGVGYGFPAIGVKLAMVKAGQRFAGEKATELYGVFTIPQDLLEIIGDEPRMRSDRVVIGGMSRVSSIAYRPEFFPWAMDVPVTFNKGWITPDQMVNLVRLAGFSVGIGEWRIDKKGTFGTFDIEEVKAL